MTNAATISATKKGLIWSGDIKKRKKKGSYANATLLVVSLMPQTKKVRQAK